LTINNIFNIIDSVMKKKKLQKFAWTIIVIIMILSMVIFSLSPIL